MVAALGFRVNSVLGGRESGRIPRGATWVGLQFNGSSYASNAGVWLNAVRHTEWLEKEAGVRPMIGVWWGSVSPSVTLDHR